MGAALGRGASCICGPYIQPKKRTNLHRGESAAVRSIGAPAVDASPVLPNKAEPAKELLHPERAKAVQPQASQLNRSTYLIGLATAWSIVSWSLIRVCIRYLPDWAANTHLWVLPFLYIFWRQRLDLHLQSLTAQAAEKPAVNAEPAVLQSSATTGKSNDVEDANNSATRELSAMKGIGAELSTRSRADDEEAVYGSADAIDAKVEALMARLTAERPPKDPAAIPGSGWLDCSKKNARVFLAARPRRAGEPLPRIVVCIRCRTQDQVKSLPMLQASGDRISGGAIPIYLSMAHWPTWFPFCDSVELIDRISPSRAIWRTRFKFLGISVEMICLAVFNDLLDTEGCVEVLMTSPPHGMAGRRWLGTIVPQPKARFQNECISFRIAGYPTSEDHCDAEFQCEIFDFAKEGLTRITIWLWQFLSTRVTGTIEWMQNRFPGSAMEKDYNGDGEVQANIRAMLMGVHQRMLRHLKQKSKL